MHEGFSSHTTTYNSHTSSPCLHIYRGTESPDTELPYKATCHLHFETLDLLTVGESQVGMSNYRPKKLMPSVN